MAVSDWSTTAGLNVLSTGVSGTGGVNIDEGMAPSGVNNAIRSVMSQVADYTRRGTDLASASTLNLDSIDTLLLNVTGTTTVTAVTLTTGHWRIVRATGAFKLTASGNIIINGRNSVDYTTVAGDLLLFEGYGSSVVRVWIIGSPRGFFSTPAATTSGTAVGFTGLPPNIKRMVLHIGGVSTSGTSIPMIQIGDSGGYENASYVGNAMSLATAPAISATAHSTGWVIAGGWAAAAVAVGFLTIERYQHNQQAWAISGNLGRSDSTNVLLCAGTKTLSAELDRIQLTTVGGTDTFDAGEIQLNYELYG